MTPRIPALGRAHIQPGLLELPAYRRSESEDPFNIYRTLAHHPSIVTQWLGFADALRFDGQLSGRDRELLILRTAVNCNCEYEWGQHVSYAEASGVREAEFRALRRPLDDWSWSQSDRV